MKCKVIIDKKREQEVIIYAHERTKYVKEIEQFINSCDFDLIGYDGKNTLMLNPSEVCCFIVEKNKVYALTENEKLQLKQRLYQLEDNLGNIFVKINQSCLGNIKMIDRFDASVSGALLVRFKNGYTDYVSRRQLKEVKERLGF